MYIAYRDLDGDGDRELLLLEGTKLTVYTVGATGIRQVAENEMYTATSRFLDSGDANYPGLIYFCVGGGKEQCYYLSLDNVINRKFVLIPVWSKDIADKESIEILTDSTTLYTLSREAYEKDNDIDFSLYVPQA